jgi:hypothetical protein
MQFGPCSCWCGGGVTSQYYYGSQRIGLIIVATFGQTQASGKPNVFAFDGNGNLLWSYLTGWFVGVNQTNIKVVEGITRDGDGNIYLAYATTGKNGADANGIATGDFAFGIQKLDQNGNLLQDWSPVGWTLAGNLNASPVTYWSNPQRQLVYGKSGQLPEALWWNQNDNSLYWSHVGKLVTVGSGTAGQRFDYLSKLDLNFNELTSWGGSNYAGVLWSQANLSQLQVNRLAGKPRVDNDGNIHIDTGLNLWTTTAGTGTAPGDPRSHTKMTPSGTVLTNARATQPYKVGSFTGVGYAAGNRNTFRQGYELGLDLGSHGYLFYPFSPNMTDDLGGNPGTGTDRPTIACRTSIGAVAPWCTAVNDACANTVITVARGTVSQRGHIFAIDNGTVGLSINQAPVWAKTMCDWTWGHGDRFTADSAPQGGISILYAQGRLFVSMGGADTQQHYNQRGALTNSPCRIAPNPTFNDQAVYGLWAIDATTGAQLVLQTNDNINNTTGNNATPSFLGQGIQGLQYHAASGNIVAVGQYNTPYSNGNPNIHGPYLFSFSFGLSTIWRVDLSGQGVLGLNATDATCTYADAS